MTALEQDAAVLDYYRREAAGLPCPPSAPLAGLRLGAFRASRDRLVRAGALVRNSRGRWIPTGAPR